MIQSNPWVDRPRLGSCAFQLHQVEWPPRGFTTEILNLLLHDIQTTSLSHHLGLPVEEVSTIRFAELADCDQRVFVAEQNKNLRALLRISCDRLAGSLIGLNLACVEDLALAKNVRGLTICQSLEQIQNKSPYPIDMWTLRVPNTQRTVLGDLQAMGFEASHHEVRTVNTKRFAGRDLSSDYVYRTAQPEDAAAICWLLARDCYGCRFEIKAQMSPYQLARLHHWQTEQTIASIQENIFVILDQKNRLVACAIYERFPKQKEFNQFPIARVRKLAFDLNTHQLGLESALFVGLVKHLQEQGFCAVQVEIPLAGLASVIVLETLQAIGFEIESIVRCLEWWPYGKKARCGPLGYFSDSATEKCLESTDDLR